MNDLPENPPAEQTDDLTSPPISPIPELKGLQPYKPSHNCKICNHPHREAIDHAIFVGMPYRDISLQFQGFTPSVTVHHRKACWPVVDADAIARARAAAAVPPEQKPAILGNAGFSVRRKEDRLAALDEIWKRCLRVIEGRARMYAHVPGGDTGLLAVRTESVRVGKDQYKLTEVAEFDAALVKEMRGVMEQATRETGEWLEAEGKVTTRPTDTSPMVLVLGSGAPIEGDLATARYVIQGTKGRRAPVIPGSKPLDARQEALSGIPSTGATAAAGQDAAAAGLPTAGDLPTSGGDDGGTPR